MNLLPIVSSILVLVLGVAANAQIVREAEGLLQSKKYDEAAQKLAECPLDQREGGYADWLRAVALQHAGKPADAVVACDAVPAGSPWNRKARLLKARLLTDLKKHAEAEAIFSEEAARVLSPARKDELAGLLASFGDEVAAEPAPGDLDAPKPDLARAATLYQRALEVEFLTPGFMDETIFKLAVIFQKLNQHKNAMLVFNDYLVQFDKEWKPLFKIRKQDYAEPVGAKGSVGPTLEKPRDAKRFLQAGKHIHEARLKVAESQLALRQLPEARKSVDDLMALQPPAEASVVAAAAWLRCMTFGEVPPPPGKPNEQAQQVAVVPGDPTKQNEALQSFLAAHPTYLHAPQAALMMADNHLKRGLLDAGIAGLQAYIDGKGYQFDPASEANTKPDLVTGLSPAELLERDKQAAFFRIGQLEFGRKKFEVAIARWHDYTVKFPNGVQWAAAQQGIIDAEFQLGIEAVAAEDEKLARERFDAFLTRYPLDQRARQILFIYGQTSYAKAMAQEMKLLENSPPAVLPEATLNLYRESMDQWSRLITKYPQTEESSLALYNTALILTEKLDRLEEGLAMFRRLTWGNWAGAAKERVAILEEKSLAISAPRIFRTNEIPQLVVSVRNIKKLKVSRYALDLEGWLRSAHRLGGLEKLDVDLIAPEKTWEIEVPNFQPWRSIQQMINLPFAENAGGACVVRVEGDDWQATTLVVRSDIEIISEATRGEVLVFALNARENKPAEGATVLISDGTKIIATGVTGADGVFRHKADLLPNTTRAFVLTPQGAMVSGLDLTALTKVEQPRISTHTTFDRQEYFPGQTVQFLILRHLLDGSKLSPAKGTVTLRIVSPDDRLVMAQPADWNGSGAIQGSFNIPKTAPAGEYKVQLLDKEEKVFVRAPFNVVPTPEDNGPQLSLKLDQSTVLAGGAIQATLFANWPWGLPVAEEEVEVTFADGKSQRMKTDAAGVLKFAIGTLASAQDIYREDLVSVSLPRAGCSASVQGRYIVTNLEWGMRLRQSLQLVAADAGVPVKIHTQGYDQRPVAKKVKARFFRFSAPPPSRVLEGVPWISYAPPAASEETVEEFILQTDATSGNAEHILKGLPGGHYGIHFMGDKDKLLETQRFYISGAQDPHGLRLFSPVQQLDEGTTVQLNLQALKAHSHVLITVNGDDFLSHQILAVQPGMTLLPIEVTAAHAPNFRVTATTIEGTKLQAASMDFSVRRGLKIALKPGAKPEDSPSVEVTDLAGKPVPASVLGALIKTSPDPDAGMAGFALSQGSVFPNQRKRDVRLAVHTSAALMFPGTSVKINAATGATGETKTIAANDQERLLQVQGLELNFNSGNTLLSINNGRFAAMNCFVQTKGPGSLNRGSLVFAEGVQRGIDSFIQSSMLPAVPDAVETIRAFTFVPESDAVITNRPVLFRSRPRHPQVVNQMENTNPQIFNFNGAHLYQQEIDPASELRFGSGNFDGFASGEQGLVAMPDSLKFDMNRLEDGQWRLQVRAWSAEHGMVEASMPFVRRHSLGLEVVKRSVTGGQSSDGVLVVTNRDKVEGKLTAQVHGYVMGKQEISLNAGALREVFVFSPGNATWTSLAEMTLTNAAGVQGVWHQPWATMGAMTAPRLPRQLQSAGGVITEADEILLQAGGGAQDARNMHAVIFRTPTEMLISMGEQVHTLQFPPEHLPAAELLARVTLMQRLRQGTDAEKQHAETLRPLCQDLVSQLALLEVKGGWAWGGLGIDPDILTTAQTWWAMQAASKAGIVVSDKLKARLEKFLEANYAGIPADDYDKKAAVLHAMAAVGRADYANAAPILRVREKLSDTALAFLTAALIRMERAEEATQLLQILEARAERGMIGTKIATATWKGSEAIVRLSEREFINSMMVWCYAKLQPGSAIGAAAVNGLLASRVMAANGGSLALGPVTVALDAWFSGANDWREPGYVNFSQGGVEAVQTNDLTTIGMTPSVGGNKIAVRPRDGKKVIFTLLLEIFPQEVVDAKPWPHPEIASRQYFHSTLLYGDTQINATSTSPVKNVELGQRVRVEVKLRSSVAEVARHPQYLIWDEPIPACFQMVPGSLQGNWDRVEIMPGHLRFAYGPGVIEPLRYELVAVVPGESTAAASIVSDAYDPAKFRPGTAATFTVLKPGEKSPDVYEMNLAEHFELAKRTFDGGISDESIKHLDALTPAARRPEFEKDLARMRLWLLTDKPNGDASQIVQAFETLNERHPSLVIPFDRILKVGAAYQKIGEHERGAYVFSAAIDANFLSDSGISAALEDNQDYAGSVDFQEKLWFDASDSEDPRAALFALSQSLFRKAGEADKLPVRRGGKKLEKPAMLGRSRDLLQRFITLYPSDALADDAAFSLANTYFALKDYPGVVGAAEAALQRYAESPFLGQYQYMAALGHFWQFHFEQALAAAAPVAQGESKDRDLAGYITGQVYHAQGKPAEAVEWYTKVKAKYLDAEAALLAFEEKKIGVPEIATFKPGEAVKLSVDHRNVKQASLQIYKVDLMKLYLREKNLSRVTRVNLAGIAPEAAVPVDVSKAAAWTDHKVDVDLPMKEEGAYLVIARGDDLFTSGLVLITALRLDVRENAATGSVRVNVLNAADGAYVADAEVKAIASDSAEIQSGQTDPRGIFEASGLKGMATVIVRLGENRFAFHRGAVALNSPPPTSSVTLPDPQQIQTLDNGIIFDPPQIPQSINGGVLGKDAYLQNLNLDNKTIQDGNINAWDAKRRTSGKGVQAEKALKK